MQLNSTPFRGIVTNPVLFALNIPLFKSSAWHSVQEVDVNAGCG